MQLTDFHAKYMGLVLSKSTWGSGYEKLAATLADARVDLNPHQVEAALFAFHSPFMKGAILADEVGLGKTIEAGLVIAQMWAEQKRRILVVVPASLRAQWRQELIEKFYLPAVILDSDAFRDCEKAGMPNPFEQEAVVITSYHFAHARAAYIRAVTWDMAVIDEAHRLRNVYKSDNIMATALHEALGDCFKLLLTATPLQNSLLELYGLVGFIDDHIFGDLDSFKAQFSFLRGDHTHEYDDLSERLHTLCIRTLRRQVTEYIRYTERLPLTQEFIPTAGEQEFYEIIYPARREFRLLFAGFSEDGADLSQDQLRRLFDLSGEQETLPELDEAVAERLETLYQAERGRIAELKKAARKPVKLQEKLELRRWRTNGTSSGLIYIPNRMKSTGGKRR